MAPPSYTRSVIQQNINMRRMTVYFFQIQLDHFVPMVGCLSNSQGQRNRPEMLSVVRMGVKRPL